MDRIGRSPFVSSAGMSEVGDSFYSHDESREIGSGRSWILNHVTSLPQARREEENDVNQYTNSKIIIPCELTEVTPYDFNVCLDICKSYPPRLVNGVLRAAECVTKCRYEKKGAFCVLRTLCGWGADCEKNPDDRYFSVGWPGILDEYGFGHLLPPEEERVPNEDTSDDLPPPSGPVDSNADFKHWVGCSVGIPRDMCCGCCVVVNPFPHDIGRCMWMISETTGGCDNWASQALGPYRRAKRNCDPRLQP